MNCVQCAAGGEGAEGLCSGGRSDPERGIGETGRSDGLRVCYCFSQTCHQPTWSLNSSFCHFSEMGLSHRDFVDYWPL